VPHLKQLYKENKDKGLVLIGIHSKNGGDKMKAYVEEQKLPYPVAHDSTGKTVKTYGGNSYPDYFVIDRAGNLRFADLANSELDRAVAALLTEAVPGTKESKVGLMDLDDAAGRVKAQADLAVISTTLETYRMLSGVYPSEAQGLKALVEKPAAAPEPRRWKQQFKTLPKDAWGQDYIYRYPGKKDPSTFEVLSMGPDEKEQTDDDISSQAPQ
jgi:type II secretion system protein G